MSDLKVVPISKPGSAESIAAKLRELADEAERGDYETLFVIAINPAGSWRTVEVGTTALHPLMKIGIIESVKTDILAKTEGDAAP